MAIKKKRGRPTKIDKSIINIGFKVTEQEHNFIKSKAGQEGVPIAQMLRKLALK